MSRLFDHILVFDIGTAMNINNAVFWAPIPCRLIYIHIYVPTVRRELRLSPSVWFYVLNVGAAAAAAARYPTTELREITKIYILQLSLFCGLFLEWGIKFHTYINVRRNYRIHSLFSLWVWAMREREWKTLIWMTADILRIYSALYFKMTTINLKCVLCVSCTRSMK